LLHYCTFFKELNNICITILHNLNRIRYITNLCTKSLQIEPSVFLLRSDHNNWSDTWFGGMWRLINYFYSHLCANAQIYSHNRILFVDTLIKTYPGYHYNLSLLCTLGAGINTGWQLLQGLFERRDYSYDKGTADTFRTCTSYVSRI